MKRNVFLFLCAMVALSSSAFAADYARDVSSKYASTGSDAKIPQGAEAKTSVAATKKVLPRREGSVGLIDSSVVNLRRLISDLETRIANLERENRFQNERMRRMDRTITNLKRRS